MNGVKLELLKLALASHLSKDAHEPVDEHDMTFVCEAAIELLDEHEKFVEARGWLRSWVDSCPDEMTKAALGIILFRWDAILDDSEVVEVWKA